MNKTRAIDYNANHVTSESEAEQIFTLQLCANGSPEFYPVAIWDRKYSMFEPLSLHCFVCSRSVIDFTHDMDSCTKR